MSPVCRKCKGTGLIETFEDGEMVSRQCICRTMKLKLIKIDKLRAKMGVWPHERQYEFKDYIGEASRRAVDLLENYVNRFSEYSTHTIYVYGESGTQKTTVMQWVAYKLTEIGVKAKFYSMPALLNLLTTSSSFHSDAERRLIEKDVEALLSVDVLILDESFDKTKSIVWSSGTQTSVLDKFLRERMQDRNKPCIFISNMPPDSIEETFRSSFLASLIRRNLCAILEFKDTIDTNPEAGKRSLWDFQKPAQGLNNV